MNKIAIIGISTLFPDAETPEQYWQNLLAQKDSRSTATAVQMTVDPQIFFDPKKGVTDKYYCLQGGYIRDFAFDPSGYKLPAEYIAEMDDLFQWSLYVAREALQDAGYADDEAVLQRTGVILGNLSFPTQASHRLFAPIYQDALEAAATELLADQSLDLEQLPPHSPIAPDNLKIAGYPAAFAAQALGLGGAHFALDAACASSLYAVKLASQQLLSGKADLMLAGAVSRADPFFINMGFSIFRAYPEGDAGSAPLNSTSGGLFAGEGAGMFALKRHADAVRDGDEIYAVISGVGLSNDGKGKFLLQPNSKGQVLAFERAYADADLHPAEMDYIECHATGTPVGDIVELNSMEQFFGRYDTAPLIGSAKSNFGHLLTAAGMAGMTKVILGMAHRQIPATLNLSAPLVSKDGLIGGEQMVRETAVWPQKNHTPRAAVSAFGFGGTNAHLILEKESPVEPQSPTPQSPISIVGMDAFFGECDGLDELGRMVYDGEQAFVDVPNGRWQGIESQPELLKRYGFADGNAPKGAFISDFDMDFFHFKIPPNNDQPIPQQLLILKVADRAIRDAGVEAGGNVAVIIAAGAELALHRFRGRVDLTWQIKKSLAASGFEMTAEQEAELEAIAKNSIHEAAEVNQYTSFIGNIMASRISALWDFSGPSFTLSAEENSTFKALETAQLFLSAGEVDAVVVGAVDLAGGVESVLARHQQHPVNGGAATMSFDANADGWLIGEGAGAVVLKRKADAERDGDRVYATVDEIAIVQGMGLAPSSEMMAETCKTALTAADIAPADVGYVELFGSGIAAEDAAEMGGLTAVYTKSTPHPTTAIGSVKANIGHTFTASGIASLIKTAHALYHRYIPAVPGWTAPKAAKKWQNSPFYVPTESRPWFVDEGKTGRRAAINGLGGDGSYAHLILSDSGAGERGSRGDYLTKRPFVLLTAAADDEAGLSARLDGLRELVEGDGDLVTIAAENNAITQETPQATYLVSIVGHDKKGVLRDIKMAQLGVGKAMETGAEWKTPSGSYFAGRPLGQTGDVAFVYPGAFSAYPGLGRDFFRLFPQLHRDFADKMPNPSALTGEKELYPRTMSRMSEKEMKRHMFRLMSDSVVMLQAGATYSTLATMMLRDQFGVQPSGALGYSLGEMTMMFGLGVWAATDNKSDELRRSPLFTRRLSGAQEAVREFWNLPPANREDRTPIWAIFVLKTDVERVKTAVSKEPRVYLTHINTSTETVIGGDPAACQRVLADLACDFMPVPYSHVIHCEPMASERDEFVKLNLLPVDNNLPLNFYFAASDHTSLPDSVGIANNIAAAACQGVDFPALVGRAYDDGARIFVELGPRSASTWWVKDILSERDHLAVAIDRRSKDDHTMLIHMLAQLASHRVPMDLSSLYADLPIAPAKKVLSLVRTVSLTKTHIWKTFLTDENKATFAGVKKREQLTVNNEQLTINEDRGGVSALPPVMMPTIEAVVVSTATTSTGSVSADNAEHSRRLSGQIGMSKAKADTNGEKISPVGRNDIDIREEQPMTTKQPDSLSVPAPLNVGGELGVIETDFIDRQLEMMDENMREGNRVHETFLNMRQTANEQMAELVKMQIQSFQAGMGDALPIAPDFIEGEEVTEPDRTITPHDPNRPNNYITPEQVIWGPEDLIGYAGGSIVPMFGEEYAIIDNYKRRVRLPMLPYLLVDRVTKLDGKRGEFKPSTMTTEYDIPFDAWYSTDGQIPWAVSVESGQCDLLLISYLGIDFQNKSERVYRLLDCTLTFLEDMPLEGHTLRYDISINSFAQSGDSLLFFFSYNCFVGDTMVLKMRGGVAGFFTDKELAGGKGIIHTERELQAKRDMPKQHFAPPLTCARTSFGRADLLALGRSELTAVFGEQYTPNGLNPSLHMPPEAVLMIDRITEVDPTGGAWGLGLIVSEKDLEPDDWYFPCHFKDDEVLAGSLVAEGCSQLLQFYLLYLGMQTQTQDARFQPVPNLGQVVRTRKQIMASSSKLIYRMEITEIGLSPKPYAKANVDIIYEGVVVVDFKNLGLMLSEKESGDPYKQLTTNSEQLTINENLPVEAFRQRTALFDDFHIENFALGSISACFGPDFQVFEGRRIPRTPNGDLKLFSRIVEINAERFGFKGEPNLTSEYDVPVEAWYYTQNSYASTMPYSVLMEIALQPCGFLSAYLGSTLAYPEQDFYFRNLDGNGKLSRDIDLRGKTISNRVVLLSSTSMPGIIIQKFGYAMSCDGELFYEGTAVFGYFQPASLADQVGLDRGQDIKPWYEQNGVAGKAIVLGQEQGLYQPKVNAPHYRLAGQQLNFLDSALVVANGGRNGKGYVYAAKTIDPNDWFFTCHFYQDPVMPGSLGIDAIIQAMQIFALEQGLGGHLTSPYFTHADEHEVVWIYRGQIGPGDGRLYMEIDITDIKTTGDQVLVIGDASLWKTGMRIYEAKGVAIRLAGD